MNRILSLIAICASLTAVAEVKIQWLETEHNFGAFDENDGEVTCEFRFVNVGDEPVRVSNVRTSCGCTTSKPPRKAIQPGDTATVSATYNPVGRPGKFEKKIYVDMNTNPQRNVLAIHGTVIGSSNTLRGRFPIDAGDSGIKLRKTTIPFGEVVCGRIKNEFLEVYNASSDTLRPTFESVPKYMRTAVKDPAIAPGENKAYAIVFDSSAPGLDYGIVTDSITYRPAPDKEPVNISIVANVVEDFSELTPQQRIDAPIIGIESRSIDFGTFPTDGIISRKLTISNRGKDQMQIRRVYSADPGVTVSVDKTKVKKGKEATVTVTVDPALIPSELLDARISIIVNDPQTPTTIVRAVGFKEEKK